MAKTRIPKDDDEEKIVKENIQKRFKTMFSGKGEPLSNMSIQEVEALKKRVAEMEGKLAQQGTATLPATTFEAAKVSDNQPLTPKPVAETQKNSAPNFAANALRISQITLVASIIAASFYLYLALQFGAWQLYAWSVDIWVLALVGLIDIILVRRGHAARAMWLLLLAISTTFIGAVALIEGIGLLLGVSTALLIPIIAGQTLPEKAADRAVVFGVVSGVVAIVLDLFLPAYRFPRPEPVRVFLPMILGVVILLFGYMTIRQLRNYSLRTKILLLGIGGVLVTALTLVAVVVRQSSQFNDLAQDQLGQSVDADLAHITEGVYNMVTAQDELVQQMVNYSLNVAGEVLNTAGSVSMADESIEWTAINQFTQESVAIRLPKMLVGTTWLGQNTSLSRKTFIVDEVQNLIGGTATIFQRINEQGDMLRVATNVQTLDGERAIGTYIPAIMPDGTPNPVVSTVLGGETYRGNAYVVNAWYDAAYQPIVDETGDVIGMLYVGVKQQNVESLRQAILRTQVGKTGYVYVLGSDGNDQGRYIISQQGQQDGENVWETQDTEGNYVIQTIINKAVSLEPGETASVRYQWQNPGEPAPRWKIARIAYYAPWHWVIASSIYEDELAAYRSTLQKGQSRMVAISGATALAIALFIGFVSVITARSISRPVGHLASVATQITAGNLDITARIEQQDEIGVLAAAFNNMTTQLRGSIGLLEERTRDLKLASEVGHAITERSLDIDLYSLLSNAVEIIRDRFDLYYTQIYLPDATERTLTLFAGTGVFGSELRHQRHHLVVGSGSLNGRAFIEKRAVIVADTKDSPNFLPNPLLPNTRSEMVIPLIVSGKVVGVLDMQSEQPGALNENNLPAFQALAGQLAITIQNAALFADVQEARSEVEAQIQRFTKQGWQEFLDAIDRGQKIGFEFNKSQIVRLEPDALLTSSEDQDLSIPITVTGAKIGEIHLPVEQDHAWTPNEKELIKVTSAQLAQHIENLRLLAQAERYRVEAEQAVRRLTREGWENYQQSRADEAPGYMFNLVDVQPLPANSNGHVPAALKQPLSIGGETIGELAVDGLDDQAEVTEIITAVAEQLSQHVENLRLAEETEKRSSELATMAGQLSEALDIARLANWEYDVARDRFIFNDHFYSIFHTSAQEVGGYEISSAEYAARFVHPDDVHMVGQEIGKALASTDRHYNVQLEHRILYADGGVGYIAVNVHIERDEQGNILRYYGANQDITERKKAEIVIQESEARLSEALEIARLANWEYDLERDIFTFNDQFYSIFHTTADQVGGYQLSSAQYAQLFVHPDDAALVGVEIGKAIASTDRHYTKQLEHRILFADGGVGYISVDINIERDESGKITRWYGANQDITERKKAEIVIQESEARLSEALEIARLANWEYDVARDRFLFNDHFYAIFHTTAQEVGGYEISSEEYAKRFVHPDDMPIVGQEIGKALSSTDRHYNAQLEHRILYADGGVGYISVNIHIERDEQGNILRYYGANQDITERKLAEDIIAQRATQLATVASLSSTTSTLLDPDKLLQTVVDLTKERFGLYHAHIYLADESWKTLLLAAGADEVGRQMVAEGWNIPMDHEQSIVARTARTRQSVIANDVIRDKSSSFLSNQLLADTRSEMAVPMIVGGNLLGVFDVQADKVDYFTEEDANIYTTLAAQVAIALQNARLYKEQAATVTQLRELDKLKSSFLANMSHELRTPLNSILGFTDVILEELDGPLTEHMDNDLRLIQKNGQHLLHLINDVLDMAKIEAGRMNLSPENFKAFEVMEEVTNITSTLASEKNLALFIDETSEQDVEIYADRTRLRQVMINLVNNAIKFTEAGKVSLKVTSLPGARVLIAVQDTGIGIAPEKLDAIFQEFTQVDASSTRKAGGTGLGLPISRRLVEMHGGRLWAESTGVPGEGSTFFVELPIEARISEVVEKQAT